MRSLIIIPLALAVLACGGGQDSTGTAGTTGGEAAGGMDPGSALSDVAGTAAEKMGLDANAQSCLSLVAQNKLAEATPVCMKAVEQNPDNPQLKTALETAQSGALADPSAAAQKAASGVMGDTEAPDLSGGAEAAGDEAQKQLGQKAGDLLGGQTGN